MKQTTAGAIQICKAITVCGDIQGTSSDIETDL